MRITSEYRIIFTSATNAITELSSITLYAGEDVGVAEWKISTKNQVRAVLNTKLMETILGKYRESAVDTAY